MQKINSTIDFIKTTFNNTGFIPLHEPFFQGNEKKYLNECIDSTFVSYLGKFVGQVEDLICDYTKARFSIATVSGTSALHLALISVGVKEYDEVLTQALSFVASTNAIKYCNASPIFIDSDKENLGMCPTKLKDFLEKNTTQKDGHAINKTSQKIIKACLPVHILGHPSKIEEIVNICTDFNIPVVEDSAESLGSLYKGKHTGTFGKVGVFSFNGNKTVTSGGGGIVVTNDKKIAEYIKHISTTAKKPHKWEYFHDLVGFNYRMPNLNAAVACAQLESLDYFLENKRDLAQKYESFFEKIGFSFFKEKEDCKSNYWLNALILEDRKERDLFLEELNKNSVMCRPVWTLLNKLPPFKNCQTTNLSNAQWLEDRLVNIPSSVRPKMNTL
ncbi:LegC family aminotransferase [Bacteriovoracales bacterium]|nr:LegC family aminotransferase [Bacteriovoracales bacterium]